MAPPPPPPPHESDSCRSEAAAPAVVTTVDVTAARDLIISSAGGGHRYLYLDVRAEEELAKLGHLVEPQNCLNVPYMFITPQGSRVKNAQFVEQVASLLTNKEEPVLVGCQSGKRSELACLDLQAAGFKKVKNMGGGYLAWVHHGFPVHHSLPVPGNMEHDTFPRPPTPPPAPAPAPGSHA
ncbi:hypothetical protein BDA96_04G002900 [Sorghum bicolor]|uniref:Rhodanese domain-containing protein n=2 Tax=Sorghum bicolor TaxID=4558 RepID=A0A921UGT2_SORBI|nr:thiosulfate sulfurtransferase 18 [Sorghum bicolor]EES06099.1 hypothetical protein SORBI_3004G002600 [Sorghum bicolor]KAG0531193.1 hypothetical protein BDA96_04G002900 [Sorghum bicolor]|eukprot:XP_002453123.1 thiosulfate sulfurtransferase 18 [Sorghum bicolor]